MTLTSVEVELVELKLAERPNGGLLTRDMADRSKMLPSSPGHSGTKRGPGVAETETLIRRIIAIATCELMNLVCLTYADFGSLDQIGELSTPELYKMTEQVVQLGYLNAA